MIKLILFLWAATFAQAATLYVSPIPMGLISGDTFDIVVGFVRDPSAVPPEDLILFNIDLKYSTDLIAGDPEELGYFRSNGVFFFFLHDTNAIVGISDVLAGGDSLQFDDFLFRVPFTYSPLPGVETTVAVNPDSSFLNGPDFTPIPFVISDTQAPASTVPEPATLGCIGAALVAMGSTRLRRR
jgi:hypothetical protein